MSMSRLVTLPSASSSGPLLIIVKPLLILLGLSITSFFVVPVIAALIELKLDVTLILLIAFLSIPSGLAITNSCFAFFDTLIASGVVEDVESIVT